MAIALTILAGELLFRYVLRDPELTLRYIRVLAWPIVVLTALAWLRHPLRRLVDRVRSGEGPGFKFDTTPVPEEANAAASALVEDEETPAGDLSPASESTLERPRQDVGSALEEARRKQIEELAEQMAVWGYSIGLNGGPQPIVEVEWVENGKPVIRNVARR